MEQNNTGFVRFCKAFWKKTTEVASYLWKDIRKIYRLVSQHPLFYKTVLSLLILMALGIGALALWATTLTMPDLGSFDSRLVGVSTKIYDRTGDVLLYDVNQNVRRTLVPFDKISQKAKDATVAIEDDSFYQHNGIRIGAIIRAVFANITSGGFSQGGSTITQQVIKNSLLTTDKTISRKLKEWILAVKLERAVDKDTILNLYLNQAPYGGNIYGIEEASEAYFGKPATDLTLSEAAYLASIPQAPSYYSPFGKHVDELEKRKNLVLKKMLDNDYITESEYTAALTEKPTFLSRSSNVLKAPHFVMFVRDYLVEKYGEEAVDSGGLKVITTLDYDLESKAEDVVKTYMSKNKDAFKADNAALVTIDPKTGQILTMVGSRDYFEKDFQGNFNAATGHRQPGSSFKPFVYSTLFNKGYTPDTILFDTNTEFSDGCNELSVPVQTGAKCYSPQNYEGGYKGPMSVRAALAESRNIPAVKALYLAGIPESIKTARAMGIQSLTEPDRYGLSLVLGGAEVSPLDMASAYGVFAQGGVKHDATAILKVTDRDGTVLEEYSTSSQQVIPEQSALLTTNILADRYARAPIFGSQYLGTREIGLKTGTTNDSRDAWIIGFSPSLSVSAWIGNNDNSPMVQKASALIVAPMWKEFMLYALSKYPEESFKQPYPIDTTNLKPIMQGQWQNPEGIHDILYYVDKNNPLGDAPSDPTNDPQFEKWDYGVQNWLRANGFIAADAPIETIPEEEVPTRRNSRSR